MSADRACSACLGRTWLIAQLAGSIEIARHQKRRLREILALSDEKLIVGLGGVRAATMRARLRGDASALPASHVGGAVPIRTEEPRALAD